VVIAGAFPASVASPARLLGLTLKPFAFLPLFGGFRRPLRLKPRLAPCKDFRGDVAHTLRRTGPRRLPYRLRCRRGPDMVFLPVAGGVMPPIGSAIARRFRLRRRFEPLPRLLAQAMEQPAAFVFRGVRGSLRLMLPVACPVRLGFSGGLCGF